MGNGPSTGESGLPHYVRPADAEPPSRSFSRWQQFIRLINTLFADPGARNSDVPPAPPAGVFPFQGFNANGRDRGM